ncbi:unnamed protein product [Caenorhabditis brenneri]
MNLCILLILVTATQQYLFMPNQTNETNYQPNRKSNHQGRFFLKNVNEARRILASGMLRNIAKVFGADIPVLGPAANMYRMRWSNHLEDIAAKNLDILVANNTIKYYGVFNMEGYQGFYWIHDISGAVRSFFRENNLESDILETVIEKMSKFEKAIETFLLILWSFYNLVSDFPNVPKNPSDSPLTVFFADRYELGCSFNTYALCLVRSGQQETLYKYGVPCTQCPTFCEFTENIDGTIDEGDLCVPPTTAKLAPAPLPEYQFDTSHLLKLNFVCIVVLIKFLIFNK